MSRPLFLFVLFLVAGMVSAHWLPDGVQPAWLFVPIGIVFVGGYFLWRKGIAIKPTLLLLGYLIGMFYASSYQVKQQPTLEQYVGHPVNLKGQVLEDPVNRSGAWSFPMSITSIQIGSNWVPVSESAIVKLQVPDGQQNGTKTSAKKKDAIQTVGSTSKRQNSRSRTKAHKSKNAFSSKNPTTTNDATSTNDVTSTNNTTSTANTTSTKNATNSTVSPTTQSQTPPVQYGDILQISNVPLQKPSPARNPGGFDAQDYYAQQGIAYSFTLTQKTMQITAHDDRGLKGKLFYPIRRHLLAVIQQNFSAQDSPLVAGLVLGMTDQIDPEVMDSFRLLGVVHILAVSGANVAMLILPLLTLLEHFHVSSRTRYGIAILLILLFGCLTGGGASVLRACAMSIMWCVGRMASRESDALTAWSVAVILTLLPNPLELYAIGFQLTYFITLGLLLIPQHLQPLFSKLPDKIANPLVLTFTAELISIPLLLTINPAYTPMSLLANLYIIPLLEVLVPLAVSTILLGLIHPAVSYLPAILTKWLLYLLVKPLTYAGQAGWLVQHYRPPTVPWLCAYYLWWLLFAIRKGEWSAHFSTLYTRARKWGLIFCAVLCLGAVGDRMFATKNLRVVFIDVGQGDSSLIEMPNGTVWLVDGGGIPGFQHQNFDVGEKIVVPTLAAEGIDKIDVMVMTHADEDHVRGLLAVLQHVKVKQVVVSDTTTDKSFYQQLLQEVRNRHIPMTMALAGTVWTPEPQITVTFLNPPLRHYTHTRSDTNSNSVVFSLQYGARSFLFTADYEGEVEPKLPINRHIDVLKVAHHGSGYASYTPLLKRITPTEAIISVGAHNHYGHPNPGTLQRLQAIGARIWRTDQQGAIICETDGQELHLYSWLGVNPK